MATIRRLSDLDVRAIFEAVHHNHLPPSHLEFRIVPVGPDGLKLSPPSHEFEDGLYILLKPQKKKKSTNTLDQPTVPSTLLHRVLENIPASTCPWSLSGPQFPHPTAIQQRYCYPKGEPDYSSQKGGALWTMYGIDGKEDLEYRLLHVYFSAKRAINKCNKSPISARRTSVKKTPLRKAKYLNDYSDVMNHMASKIPPHVEVTPDIFNRIYRPIPDAVGSPIHPTHLLMPVSEGQSFGDLFGMEFDHVTDSPEHIYPRQLLTPTMEEQFLDPFAMDLDDDFPELNRVQSKTFDEGECHIQAFEDKLEEMHSCLKESILHSTPEAEQGHLVSVLSNWAKQVAQSPLGNSKNIEGV